MVKCPHVLLGGGTGFIGSGIHHLLTKKGYEVTLVSRKEGKNRVTWFDICASGIPDGITAVVNVAGQNILDVKRRWNEDFKQEIWKSRVDTSLTLTRAIFNAEQKPNVFVSISSVGIYKPGDDCHDESSPVGPSFDFLSHLALEWENASKPPNCGVRCVTIRSGIVLGKNGGIVKQLKVPFFLGLGGSFASGKQPFPWIHLKDLCRMFVQAVEDDNISGVLNGVAPQPVTNQEFAKALGEGMNRSAKLKVPKYVLETLFGPERTKMITDGQNVIPKRAKEIGFTYDFPTIDSAIIGTVGKISRKNKPF